MSSFLKSASTNKQRAQIAAAMFLLRTKNPNQLRQSIYSLLGNMDAGFDGLVLKRPFTTCIYWESTTAVLNS